MHELSIAHSIIQIAEENAAFNRIDSFSEIELRIGTQSGVVIEALLFAMEEAVKESVLQHAKITIHEVKAQMECNQCKTVFEIEELYTPCPTCASFDGELIKGNELDVLKLKF